MLQLSFKEIMALLTLNVVFIVLLCLLTYTTALQTSSIQARRRQFISDATLIRSGYTPITCEDIYRGIFCKNKTNEEETGELTDEQNLTYGEEIYFCKRLWKFLRDYKCDEPQYGPEGEAFKQRQRQRKRLDWKQKQVSFFTQTYQSNWPSG